MEGGAARLSEFGPYAGWEARALAVGPDGVLRVLWAGANGAAALWSLREDEAPESLDCGPFVGWTAASLAADPDGRAHLLWVRDGGGASVWRVGDDGLADQTEFGPYDGWRAVSVAAGRAGSRLLWKGQGGRASVWDISGAGGRLGVDDERQRVHGPFAGWTPTVITLGAGGAAQFLWRGDSGGRASVWRADGAGGFTRTEYGPYTGWAAVALATGP